MIYNHKQDQVRRIEVLDKFLPYFSPPKEHTHALVGARALIDLGYTDLAIDLLTASESRSVEKGKEEDGTLITTTFGEEPQFLGFFTEHAAKTIPGCVNWWVVHGPPTLAQSMCYVGCGISEAYET